MDKSLSMRHGLTESVSPTTEGGIPSRQIILGEQQRLALEWLMGGGSVSEASQYAGVCRQTVSEWLHHDEDFRQVYQQWRDQLVTISQARLMAMSEQALDTVSIAIREKRDAKVALVVLKGLGMLGTTK